MKNTLFAAGLLTLATGGMAAAGEVQANIEVSGLFCPSCSYIVGEAMKSVESVDIVEFIEGQSGDTAVYVVSFDDAKANPAEISQVVASYGYSATVIEDPNS